MSSDKKILFVEDEPHTVMMVESRLSAAGYKVVSTNNTEDAEEIIKKDKVALIILDIMLPQEDGLSFCKRLKKDPLYKNIPVIFLTAKALDSDIKKGEDAGGQAYITKPFSADELIRKIEELLQ